MLKRKKKQKRKEEKKKRTEFAQLRLLGSGKESDSSKRRICDGSLVVSLQVRFDEVLICLEISEWNIIG